MLSYHDNLFVIKSDLIYIHHSPFLVLQLMRYYYRPGVLEINCLFQILFKQAATQGSLCLEENGDSLQLKEDHAYYHHVQLRMKICQVAR